jgi:hypothetical protein
MLAVARGRSAPTSGADAETEDRVAVSDWHRLDPSYATPAGQQSWQINARTYEACAVGCRDGAHEIFKSVEHDDRAQAAALFKIL